MGNEKITGNMSTMDMIMTMCEGNPGAMQVIMQMMNGQNMLKLCVKRGVE